MFDDSTSEYDIAAIRFKSFIRDRLSSRPTPKRSFFLASFQELGRFHRTQLNGFEIKIKIVFQTDFTAQTLFASSVWT